MGARTRYAGRFGDDKEGDFGLQSLRDAAVNIDFCEQIGGVDSQTAFILIDEKTGERTVMWNQDRRLAFAAAEAPVRALENVKIFHTDAHDLSACVELAKTARAKDVIVSVDVDTAVDGLDELLAHVDILISSDDFPHKFTGIRDERDALQTLQNRFGCKIVGKTKGKAGALILSENRFLTADGYAVPGGCKDTTGAGDAFHAGFLWGLLQDETIEDALKIANAVAALKCRALGARTALPTRKELQDFLAA